MSELSNLKIIDSTDKDDIFQGIAETGASSLSATNGTYVAAQKFVAPTTLAGFQYTKDNGVQPREALVIAVNSDKSMADIKAAKAALGEDIGEMEDQETRARKVAEPLARQFPEHHVVAIFYDEATPTELYEFLESNTPFELNALFKFGYGTNPEAGDIEGANCFDKVYAFPFPNDAKPLCDNLTGRGANRDNYTVKKLTDEKCANGQPYMNVDNQVLFDLEEGEDTLSAFAPSANENTPQQEAPKKTWLQKLGLGS